MHRILSGKLGCCLLVVTLGAAMAGEEGPKRLETSGYAETGISAGWDSGARGTQWSVDNVLLRVSYRPNGLVRFACDNALAIGGPTTSPTHAYTNTNNYYSTKAQLRSGDTGRGQFVVANNAAFLEIGRAPRRSIAVGHLPVPFGMESTLDRFDMPTYYYSNSYTAAQVFGWHYDFGVRANYELLSENPTWGLIEFALLDGRHPRAVHANGGDVSTPAVAFRWSTRYPAFGGSFFSSISGYFGRFRKRPGDIGFTLGNYAKWDRLRLHFEYLFTSTMTSYTSDLATAQAVPGTEYVGDTTTMPRSLDILGKAKPGHRAQAWSIYLEPGISLTPFWEISSKIEYGNHEYEFAKEDINLALGVTHRIGDAIQVRFLYQHFNLLGNLASHADDVRVLLGTRF